MSTLDEPFSVEQHLLVVNNVLFMMKRSDGDWSEQEELQLDMINNMRKAFEDMWHKPEYQTKAKQLVEQAYQKLDQCELAEWFELLTQLEEVYTMNKLHNKLD